ncbi:MAG: hypothetical protein ACE37H_18275 [Phycisphaeraceae bacterium]
MTDQTTSKPTNDPIDDLARELREAEKLERGLDRALSAVQPPFGAVQRLMAKLGEGVFHESQLTLDDAGPYSFEKAAAAQARADAERTDLLAAGLEEQEIDDETDAD